MSTGVTIAPGPIAGLLCAPHDESCQEWTVARPYMPGLAKHSSKKDPEKAIGPAHIHRLARPRCAYDSWAWSVTTDWPQPKVDLRSLSPRAVLTLEELLDCTLKTPLSWYRQYNRDFLDLREDVALGQHVVGFSAAEHCSWPKIDRHSGRFYEVTFSAWDRFIPVIGSMKPIKGFKDKVSYHFFPEGSEEGIALAPHTMIRQLPQE